MTSTMAGRLPLHEMVRQQLDQAREKMASARSQAPAKEKVASASELEVDFNSESEIEKLASAFDEAAELLLKEASDSVYNGAESKQGGQQLPTQNATPGTQSYKKDGSKKHAVPTSTPMEGASDGAKGNKTLVQTDENRAPGEGKAYPKEGVLKTAGLSEFASKAKGMASTAGGRYAELMKGGKPMKSGATALPGNSWKQGFGDSHARGEALKSLGARAGTAAAAGAAGYGAKKALEKKSSMSDDAKLRMTGLGGPLGARLGGIVNRQAKKGLRELEKKSSAALEYVLGLTKQAESKQGGMTLTDDQPGNNPKQPTSSAGGNEVRSVLQSSDSVINMKKIDGKRPQKRMLAEVLEEPAMSKSTDNKVHENLRNASKGGVKIAAAKAFLEKIASDPNDPRHEKVKEALKALKQ